MFRLFLITSLTPALLSACASSSAPPPAPEPTFGEDVETAETACYGTPKNCLPMSEEAMLECMTEMEKREDSACFNKLVALKRCFTATAECDESGALIENDAGDRACASENGELEACCEANAGDASCEF